MVCLPVMMGENLGHFGQTVVAAALDLLRHLQMERFARPVSRL